MSRSESEDSIPNITNTSSETTESTIKPPPRRDLRAIKEDYYSGKIPSFADNPWASVADVLSHVPIKDLVIEVPAKEPLDL